MSSEWYSTTLGEVCALQNGTIQTGPFGSQLHASDYVEHGIPVVMPANIGADGGISEEGIARIRQEDVDRLQQHKLQLGDVVFSRRGDVTRNALIECHQVGWLCGTGCLKVRLGDETRADAKYISYCLRMPETKEWLIRHAVGATMPNLNTAILSAVPLTIPPLTTQKSITDLLGALDDRITLLRETNATLEAIAQALFKSWFVDFDPVHAKCAVQGRTNAASAGSAGAADAQGHTNAAGAGAADDQGRTNTAAAGSAGAAPARTSQTDAQPATNTPPGTAANTPPTAPFGETLIPGLDPATAALFPDSFEETELGWVPKGWRVDQLGSALKIAYGKNLPTTKLLDHGFPVFGGNGCIGFYSEYLYENRQVLVACRGAASGKVNQSSPFSFVTNNSLVLEATDRLPFSYLKGFMSNADLTPFVTGSAQPQVTIDNLKVFKILQPTKDVVCCFEGVAGQLEDRIAENEAQAQTLTQLRDTLLPRLISGQLRLPEAEQLIQEQAHA